MQHASLGSRVSSAWTLVGFGFGLFMEFFCLEKKIDRRGLLFRAIINAWVFMVLFYLLLRLVSLACRT